MSGSRLGRGRAGRLAVYAGCGAVVILLIFAYRAAVSEMARLRDLHEQCSHHQESLAAQLQVIFEYKVRLEKSLADEKSANSAVKQELQQRAAREKTLRDKDGVEANQRYNSLQQDYTILQTEKQDLQEECKKREKQALDDANVLQTTLQGLRAELKQARDDKVSSMEHLKSKYLTIQTEKEKIQEKYDDLLRANGDAGQATQRLEKTVFQLTRELEETKRSCAAANASPSLRGPSEASAQSPPSNARRSEGAAGQGAAGSEDAMNLARPPSQQQNTSTTTTPRTQTIRVSEVLTKASTKSATPSSDKVFAERAKVKIPVGVLPIPRIFETDNERKPLVPVDGKGENGRGDAAAVLVDKDKPPGFGVEINPPDAPRIPAIGRHVGDQPLGRGQDQGWAWQHKVLPGVQEVGEEPNNMEKLPGLDDTGIHQDGGEYGQYEGGDYEKDPPLKNNDLHIEEGEEEGEDEDDPMDYEGNNLKVDKRPE